MCGGNPSAFCASRSVAHSDALFKTLRIHFFIQAFFYKKAFGKRNSLRAPALFILQPAIRYSLQLPHNPQKKCLRKSADKLAKTKIFPLRNGIVIIQKIAKFRKEFSEYRLLKAAESAAKRFILRAMIFCSAAYFFWAAKRKILNRVIRFLF